jgi:chromosome segregation ATPase
MQDIGGNNHVGAYAIMANCNLLYSKTIAHDASIAQLAGANANLVAQNKTLNTQITTLNTELTNTKNQVTTCNASINALIARLEQVESQITDHNTRIMADNATITTHYSEQTTKLTETKTELITKIEEVKTNIITNNISIENLKNQITELGEKIAGILESTKQFVRRTSGQFARMVGMTKALDDDYKFGEIEDKH